MNLLSNDCLSSRCMSRNKNRLIILQTWYSFTLKWIEIEFVFFSWRTNSWFKWNIFEIWWNNNLKLSNDYINAIDSTNSKLHVNKIQLFRRFEFSYEEYCQRNYRKKSISKFKNNSIDYLSVLVSSIRVRLKLRSDWSISSSSPSSNVRLSFDIESPFVCFLNSW